jgi:nucleoside-diphosphate-sugar epimerase
MSNRPLERLGPGMPDRLFAGVRVLVTGAAGFIGRWVARRLNQAGAHLILAVRKRSPAEAVFTRYSVRGTILELDLGSQESVDRLLRTSRPAVLFNLAGYGIDRSERDESLFCRLNAELPAALARAMSEHREPGWPGAAVVHAGSIAEYGPIGGDLAESSPARPLTLYGRTKLAGTMGLAQTCQRCGLAGLTARLATVYGPGEHPGRLLPTLLAAGGGPVLLSAGLQKRDFTYVEDVADGLLRLAAACPAPGEIVNLVTGVLTTVREFAEIAAQVLDIGPDRLRFGALAVRADEEMEHLPVANAKLRQLTGWAPPTSIIEGVRRTRDFFALERQGNQG